VHAELLITLRGEARFAIRHAEDAGELQLDPPGGRLPHLAYRQERSLALHSEDQRLQAGCLREDFARHSLESGSGLLTQQDDYAAAASPAADAGAVDAGAGSEPSQGVDHPVRLAVAQADRAVAAVTLEHEFAHALECRAGIEAALPGQQRDGFRAARVFLDREAKRVVSRIGVSRTSAPL